MADYSTAPTTQGSFGELIPDGTLARGFLIVKPYNRDQNMIEKPPKAGGKAKNSYLECEVTISDGPHERRKVFHNLMRGPEEKSLNMGNAQIRAILEFGGAGPHNPRGYVLDDDYGQFWDERRGGGIPVGIKIGVEKERTVNGTTYGPKNVIKAFLSPNPESDHFKDYKRLIAGDTAPATPATATAGKSPAAASWTTAAPAAASPPAAQAPPPASNGGWGAAPAAPAQAAQPATTAGRKPAWTEQ